MSDARHTGPVSDSRHRSPEEDMTMLRCTGNVANRAPIWCRRLTMLLVLCLLSMGAVGVAMGAAARQKSFPTGVDHILMYER
jgi:hypothetical protein